MKNVRKILRLCVGTQQWNLFVTVSRWNDTRRRIYRQCRRTYTRVGSINQRGRLKSIAVHDLSLSLSLSLYLFLSLFHLLLRETGRISSRVIETQWKSWETEREVPYPNYWSSLAYRKVVYRDIRFCGLSFEVSPAGFSDLGQRILIVLSLSCLRFPVRASSSLFSMEYLHLAPATSSVRVHPQTNIGSSNIL